MQQQQQQQFQFIVIACERVGEPVCVRVEAAKWIERN